MTPYLTHLKIGDRRIGPGEPAYLIAEVGINHNGNPEIARRLIDVAASAGVDAVKFQKRQLSSLYPAETLLDPTREEKEIGLLLPFLQEFELSDAVLTDLAAYSREQGLEFLCTPWDVASLDLLERIGLLAYKVSSPDLTNMPLLERLSQTGKPLILSTGMSKLSEIAATVDFLKSRGVQFALLHCQSTYPAAFKDVNLRFMSRLREFGVPVGYSGHERGISVSTVAVALGACILERHITLDRTMLGPDHAASLEPQGIQKQVRDVRIIEESLGSEHRGLSRGEIMNRLALGKSLVAARSLKPGDTITDDDVKVMGPGHGISPQRVRELVGRVAHREIAAEEQFRASDLTDVPVEELAAAFPLRWGPVVRYRDFAQMTRFNPHLFEFHLTDADLNSTPPQLPESPQELVVHAPEYDHGRLVDLASSDADTVRRSCDLLRRVMEVARTLRGSFTGTPERVRIVVHPGAMSYEPEPAQRDDAVERLCEVLPFLTCEPDVELLVENMPPYPWYFGGQWYHNAFLDVEDMLELATRARVRLCLDLSHAALSCTAGNGDLVEYVRELAPHVSHLHIADASGTDGEGLAIGEGDIDFAALMPLIATMDATLVPEIWLAHRNGGEGFVFALQSLSRFLPENLRSGDARSGDRRSHGDEAPQQ